MEKCILIYTKNTGFSWIRIGDFPFEADPKNIHVLWTSPGESQHSSLEKAYEFALSEGFKPSHYIIFDGDTPSTLCPFDQG